MALPAIADVRRAHPAAVVAVAARPSVAPLFALVPGVNDTYVLPPRGAGNLAEGAFDAALLLPNAFHAAWIARRAGIPERWGYRGDWRGPLLTRAIDRPGKVHQRVYYQRLVAALGMPNRDAEPSIAVPSVAIDAARGLLLAGGWNGTSPLATLAPGAAYGGAKRWPPEYFAGLARALHGDGAAVVLVGSGADAPTARQVEAAAAVPLVNVVGRTDLSVLAGIFKQSRAVVSNDSGAMHLAAAAGAPVVALFGPTNEQATAPASVAVLTTSVWCRPCMLRECPIDHRCMRGIPVERVREVTISHLGVGRPTSVS